MANCESPIRLARGCSKKHRAKNRKDVDGLSVRFAGSEDGTILLIMPPDAGMLATQGSATPASNERYYAVSDELETHGLAAIRATPLVMRRSIIGYYVEFDGDAWSALGL